MPDRSEYMRQWRAANREHLLHYNRRYNEEHRAERKAYDRKRRGQITSPVVSAPTKCDCCGNSGRIVEDHCHDTGVFRGWLCNNCNLGLGLIGDNIEGVKKCLDYLMET